MYYANDRMPRRITFLHNTHRPPSQYVAGGRGGGGIGGWRRVKGTSKERYCQRACHYGYELHLFTIDHRPWNSYLLAWDRSLGKDGEGGGGGVGRSQTCCLVVY